MGLWKIVCEHQFHVVVETELTAEEQNVLRGMYFRDLITSSPGKDLCSRLHARRRSFAAPCWRPGSIDST